MATHPQHTCVKRHFHISEVYFYEEISKMLGQQISNDWLRSLEKRNLRRTSCGLQCYSQSTSSWHSRNTTPQSSNPSTPRNGSFSLVGNIAGSESDVATASTKDEAKKNQDYEWDLSSDTCKLGLLYTDAAHSVLQDKEIADFVKRRNSK